MLAFCLWQGPGRNKFKRGVILTQNFRCFTLCLTGSMPLGLEGSEYHSWQQEQARGGHSPDSGWKMERQTDTDTECTKESNRGERKRGRERERQTDTQTDRHGQKPGQTCTGWLVLLSFSIRPVAFCPCSGHLSFLMCCPTVQQCQMCSSRLI